MKKVKNLFPYLLIIGLIITIGSMGLSVKAAEQPTLDSVVNEFLVKLQEIGRTSSDNETFGGIYHAVKEYYTDGICFDSRGQRCISQQNSVLKYTNDGGTNYVSLNTSQSSAGGWNTNPTNNHIYPATNASGNLYPAGFGGTATTSISDGTEVLYVVGNSSFTGNIIADGGNFVGNDAGGDLDFSWEGDTDTNLFTIDASGDKVGISEATPTYALDVGGDIGGDEYFYHNGDTNTYLRYRPDQITLRVGGQDFINMASSSGQSIITIGSTTPANVDIDYNFIADADADLYILGSNGFVGMGGVTDPDYQLEILHTSTPLKLSYDGSTSCTYVVSSGGDLTQDCSGNDFNLADDTLTTTGNISAANGTFTGTMDFDSGTFYLNPTTDRVGIGSTTPFATLSVDSNGGDQAFLVGSSTRDQLLIDANMDLFVNSDDLVVDWSSGYVGIGTTTPFTALAITDTGTQLGLAYDGTNYTTITTGSDGDLTIVPSGGDLTITGATSISATSTLSTDLRVDTDSLVVDSWNDKVGIGSTTPYSTFSIDTNSGDSAFIIGSSTSILLEVDENMDFVYYTDLIYGDYSGDRVGISSSTPMADLSIGTAGATSTIAVGRFCQYVEDQEGKTYWITLNMGAANAAAGIFATSTTACN